MESKAVDPTMEIIRLLRRREALCDEWFRRVMSQIKSGEISYNEGMAEIKKIEEEENKTKDAINWLDNYLKNVKIIKK